MLEYLWKVLILFHFCLLCFGNPSLSICHPDDEFSCKDWVCIPAEWQCDNVIDCLNADDEANCHYLYDCPPNHFMCRNGECWPKNVKCNGKFECVDQTDEDGCEDFKLSNMTLPSTNDVQRCAGYWIYMLYLFGAFILIASLFTLLNFCLFIRRRRLLRQNNNVQLVVLKTDEQ